MRFIILFLFFLIPISAFSKGMTFDEFAPKIQKYFDNKLIQDIQKNLPTDSKYQIWSWDVGDFTGDGYYDVAFSVRVASDKGKKIRTYMFADIEGYLVEVASFRYDFFEIPLEIGVVIRDNVCFITQKHKQYKWTIWGYTFKNGNLIKVDEFNTERDGKFTKETYENYLSLKNQEKYLVTSNGNIEYELNFVTLPSYPRGKIIYEGYTHEIHNDKVKYVNKGAFDWEGAEDASFKVSSSYDSDFLYLDINVVDEKIIFPDCDDCIGDYVDLWLENKPLDQDKLYKLRDRKLNEFDSKQSNYFNISIQPGNFLDVKPSVQLRTMDKDNSEIKEASQNIIAYSNLTENGYNIKCKLPLSLIGLNSINENEYYEVPCSVVLHDIDNIFRPNEKSEVSSSENLLEEPTTYGTLLLVPPNKWYGYVENIYSDKLLYQLKKYGL